MMWWAEPRHYYCTPWWRRNLYRETAELFRLSSALLQRVLDVERVYVIQLEAARVKAEEESLPKRIGVMDTRLHNLESDYILVMRRLEWWEKKCKLVQQGKTEEQIVGNIGPEP
jgi:hypothetical protein